jgi:DNA primase
VTAEPAGPVGEAARLLALVAAGTRQLRSPGQWVSWLRHAGRFAHLGFTSSMLIWAQCPDAADVRDYAGWTKAGRQVRRGEHGIKLVTPKGIKTIFDVSQTQGPGSFRPQGKPEYGTARDTLAALALRAGYTVVPGTVLDAPATLPHQHVIRAAPGDLPGLAAQIAHILVHDKQHPCDTIQGQVETDSVAFMIAARLGLDTRGFAFPHVTTWAGADPRAQPEKIIAWTGQRILRAAATAYACIDANLPATSPAITAARLAAHDRPSQPSPSAASMAKAGPSTADDIQRRIQTEAAEFFANKLAGSGVPRYLASRGLGTRELSRWAVGYAPADWTTLTSYLRRHGFSEQDLEASGLCKRSSRGTLFDVFRDRAMFPIRTVGGQVLGFIGRAAPRASSDVPKYLNSRETALYRKGHVLFGLHENHDALQTGAVPVIVEGPMDAIAVAHAGDRYAGVAPCGTALTSDQVRLLVRTAPGADHVIMLFDADPAGQRAAIHAYDLLQHTIAQPLAVTLPDGHDPASLAQVHGTAALANILASRAVPLADLVTDACLARFDRHLGFLEGKFSALRAVAPLIAAMPPVEAGRQAARTTARTGLTTSEVTDAITQALEQATTSEPAITLGRPVSYLRPRRLLPSSLSTRLATVLHATILPLQFARVPADRRDSA